MTTPAATAVTKDGRPVELERDDDRNSYLASVQATRAGLAEFVPTPEFVVFTHTETDPSFEGQGVASALVRYALDDVRARGLRIVPVCPFVRAFVQRHPGEYGDLVYASRTTVVDD